MKYVIRITWHNNSVSWATFSIGGQVNSRADATEFGFEVATNMLPLLNTLPKVKLAEIVPVAVHIENCIEELVVI